MTMDARLRRMEQARREQLVGCEVCDGPDATIRWPDTEPSTRERELRDEWTMDCPRCGKADAMQMRTFY